MLCSFVHQACVFVGGVVRMDFGADNGHTRPTCESSRASCDAVSNDLCNCPYNCRPNDHPIRPNTSPEIIASSG